MGVFKKLKDVLFDVEEDEIPTITKKVNEEHGKKDITNEIKKKFEAQYEENTIKEIKIPREELPERELIKSDSTFNFPVDVAPQSSTRASRSFDFEPEPKPKNEIKEYSRILREEPKKETNKPFKPTPIISPVYGILDQNYSKDDIVVKTDIGVKGPDLDAVRKKAYGIKPKKEVKKDTDDELIEKQIKTLDEILMEEESANNEQEMPKLSSVVLEDEVKEQDEIAESKVTKDEENIEDTLETDLFNLIDSMYESQEESEEI